MEKIAVLLAAWLSLASLPVSAQSDHGVATDAAGTPAAQRPFLHLLAGMSAGFLAAGIADSIASSQTISEHPLLLPGLAVVSATAAGFSKELLDSTGFGAPRFVDALAAVAGGFVAAGVVAGFEVRGVATSVPVLCLGVVFAIPVLIAFIQEVVWNVQKPKPVARSP